MAIATTSMVVTSTGVVLISTATAWASLVGAHQQDPVPFSAFNDGAARVYLSNSTGTLGFPLLSSGTFNASLLRSDPIVAVTSAGATSTVHVIAGRQ